MTSPIQVPNSVQEAYTLARLAGDRHEQALESAMSVALKESEKDIIERMAMSLGEHIADLEETADSDQVTNYRDALSWVAGKLVADLPVRSSKTVYAPADDDYVEVLIRGDVSVSSEQCDGCGTHNRVRWYVTTETAEIYGFDMDSDVQVRKIAGR